MGSDVPENSTGPVILRLKLRYPDTSAFIEKFAVNVGRLGIFLPTKAMRPVGSELRFELRLLDDVVVLAGVGRVASTHQAPADDAAAAYGLAIEFMRVTRESRDLVMRMLEFRREHGLGEPGLPIPQLVHSEVPATMPAQPTQLPIAAEPSERSVPDLAASPATGAASVAARASLELSLEPPRTRRRRASELVASLASPSGGTSAPSAGLAPPEVAAIGDEEVDVRRAVARAKEIASGASEADLADLLVAAPPGAAVNVAEAAAELSRQFGGTFSSRARGPRIAFEPPAAKIEAGGSAVPHPGKAAAMPSATLSPGTSSGTFPAGTSLSETTLSETTLSETTLSETTLSETTLSETTGTSPTSPTNTASANRTIASRLPPNPIAPTEPVDRAEPRRPRVSRPQRLTQPPTVFSRAKATEPPGLTTAISHGIGSGPPLPRLPAASTTLPAEPPDEPKPPRPAFERVLAELEESERASVRSAQRRVPGFATAVAQDASGLAPSGAPLDHLALDELDDADATGAPRLNPDRKVEPSAAAGALELDGNADFEILDEEGIELDFHDSRTATEPAPSVPAQDRATAKTPRAAAIAAAVARPIWTRTTALDSIASTQAPEIQRSRTSTPPTIPGRVPTQEIDLESALDDLEIDAEAPAVRLPALAVEEDDPMELEFEE